MLFGGATFEGGFDWLLLAGCPPSVVADWLALDAGGGAGAGAGALGALVTGAGPIRLLLALSAAMLLSTRAAKLSVPVG